MLDEFLNIPAPRSDEILSSYLSRFLSSNNYVRKSYINSFINIDAYKYQKNENNLTALKQAFKFSSSEINNLYFDEEWLLRIKGNSFYRTKFLFKYETRICPQCLCKDGYYKKIWCLTAYTSCHIHNCLMIDKCTCGVNISRFSENLLKCSACGLKYSSLRTEQVQAGWSLDELINTRLTISKPEINLENNPLYSLSLENLIGLILRYSHFLYQNENKKNDWTFIRNNSYLHTLLNHVFQLFGDWPNSFRRFLAQCEIQKNIDKLISEALLYFNNEQNKFLFDEFIGFVERSANGAGTLSVSRTIINKLNENSGLFVTRERAKSMLNITTESGIEKMIVEKKLITLTIKSEKRSFPFITIASIDNIIQLKKNKCSLSNAMKILNVTNDELKNIVEEGLINYLEGTKILEMNSINNLLGIFDSKIPDNLDPFASRMTVSQVIECSTLKLIDIIHLVQEGSLIPIGKNMGGLKSYYFEKESVLNYYINKNIDSKLALVDAANQLRVPIPILNGYIDEGLVKYVRSKKVKKVYLSEILIFKTRYIILNDLIKGNYWEYVKLSSDLNKRGVLSVSTFTKDAQYFVFRKQSIENYMNFKESKYFDLLFK